MSWQICKKGIMTSTLQWRGLRLPLIQVKCMTNRRWSKDSYPCGDLNFLRGRTLTCPAHHYIHISYHLPPVKPLEWLELTLKPHKGVGLEWFCFFSVRWSPLQEQILEKWHLQRQCQGKQDCGVRVWNNGLSRPLQKHIFQVTVHFKSGHAFLSKQAALAPLTVVFRVDENFTWLAFAHICCAILGHW